ncbi:MAG: zinc-binding CMP/dCMP deaminase, dCMP deaminase [Candidatus Kaiserbacteria bacterium]|nr:zinc-binding CMP/dCMP deaminase, dCMP deaminase [Candidatus Kaiserbacteria bacterium]
MNSITKSNESVIVAYVPVLHEGYLRFFQKNPGVKKIYILGEEIIADYKPLTKDIRQIPPATMQGLVTALGIFDSVEVLDKDMARSFNTRDFIIILPDEDVSRDVAAVYFPDAKIQFDSIFLMWDRHNALAERPVVPDEQITRDAFHKQILEQAQTESEKSSDIWRHVGAAIVKNGKLLLTGHNEHVPSAHSQYAHGDPRNNFSKGEYIEYSTALHAEAGLIATAASQGISLEGSDMYVTVFPCPPCAKLIAYAGIKTLYCTGGYAVLDGQDILKSRNVKIIFVE